MRKLGEILCVTCLIRFPKANKNEDEAFLKATSIKRKNK